MSIRINGDNTAANPGITGADTDTGLSFGTDEVSLNTAGTERFRVGSAGQFGIGGATYGTSGQVLTSGGASAAPSWTTLSTSNLTRSTAVATTSGTSVDFTDVPADVRRITLMYDQISFTTSTLWQVQLGDSGGFETSGYWSSNGYVFYNSTAYSTGYQTGFVFGHSTIGFGSSGRLVMENLGGNTWVYNAITATGSINSATTSWATFMSAGTKTLSDTLTQIRLTTISGTSTFDNGQVNVLYEV